MSAPRMRDEHLAWLAVREELERSTRQGVQGILRKLFGGRSRAEALTTARIRAGLQKEERHIGDVALKPSSPAMAHYSMAVHEQARRFTETERGVLRSTGQVPDWFLGAVRAAAKTM